MTLSPRTLGPKHTVAGYATVSGSVGGLLLGLVAGAFSHGRDTGLLHEMSPYVKAVATIWLNALSAIVIPLTATNVISAVIHGRDARESSILSAKAFVLFTIWLSLGALFTLALVPFVLDQLTVDSAMVDALAASLPTNALPSMLARPTLTTPTEVVALFVPRNLLKSALNEELLPLLLFSIAFAFAILRTSAASLDLLARFFHALSEALLVMVRSLVALMPIGAFAMAFIFTEGAGVGVAGILGQFTLVSCATMLGFTLVLYPLTALASGVSMRKFASAVLPAQIAAASTRSSLASLPALLAGGLGKLGLTPHIANLALPLSVAVFKVNRTVSSTVKMLFIAHLFNIELGVVQVLTFLTTIVILSFTSLGIPGGGGAFKSMAAYLAAGLPIEGYVLLEATDAIADIFKTVLNVTGDMSVATVLDRRASTHGAVAVTVASSPDEFSLHVPELR